MHCPRCRAELTERLLGEIQVDECVSCDGIWFDDDELRRARDEADPDLRWLDVDLFADDRAVVMDAAQASCPRCRLPMVTTRYGDTDVEVDCCSACHGVWLDRGEIARILNALESELRSKSSLGYLKETLKSARDLVTGSESLVSEWKDLLTVARLLQYRLFIDNPRLAEAVEATQRSTPVG